MEAAAQSTTTARLPATIRLGPVELTVASLDRAVPWYESALGLRVHRREDGEAELGDGAETVVVLHEDPQARPAGRHAGLYHYALLYPSREELAWAVRRLALAGGPMPRGVDPRPPYSTVLRAPR